MLDFGAHLAVYFVQAFVSLQKVHGWCVPFERDTSSMYRKEQKAMADKIAESLSKETRSIYDKIDESNLIPSRELEVLIKRKLVGIELGRYPIRTRSKIVKSAICEAIGYPVPKAFRKTQPRFPAQNFDVYTQKSLNVQIWNEEIDLERRYVVVRTDDNSIVTTVRIISGKELAKLDKTGTLTHKYQATMKHFGENCLLASSDTPNVLEWLSSSEVDLSAILPIQKPTARQLLPIKDIYSRLIPLVGTNIDYIDAHQERNRGSALHAKICAMLGYSDYADDGQYPDIVHQLIEVKLQTSPTIDLGMHSPLDGEVLMRIGDKVFTSNDVRYVIFDAKVDSGKIRLDNLYVVNGEHFTEAFPLFQGKVQNKKLQIPLPKNFFD